MCVLVQKPTSNEISMKTNKKKRDPNSEGCGSFIEVLTFLLKLRVELTTNTKIRTVSGKRTSQIKETHQFSMPKPPGKLWNNGTPQTPWTYYLLPHWESIFFHRCVTPYRSPRCIGIRIQNIITQRSSDGSMEIQSAPCQRSIFPFKQKYLGGSMDFLREFLVLKIWILRIPQKKKGSWGIMRRKWWNMAILRGTQLVTLSKLAEKGTIKRIWQNIM